MKVIKKYLNIFIIVMCIILFILLTFVIYLDLGTGHKELENVILIALPCFVYFVTSFNKKKEDRKKILIVYLVCYVIVLLGFILSNNRSSELINQGIISKDNNLIPFHSIKQLLNSRLGLKFGLYNIAGNFLMLTPLSILLPLISDKFRKFWNMFLVLLLTPFIVEISQYLLKLGSFDIDDIILNTSGALVLFLIVNYTKLYDLLHKLFYDVKIKENIKTIIYWILVAISLCFILSRIILIVNNHKNNSVDLSNLTCVQNNETFLARKDNYNYFSKCDYGNSFIIVGNNRYQVKDFIQTKYYNDSMIDKLQLFKKEIITNAYLEGNTTDKVLLYEDQYTKVFLYQYERLMVEMDNELYDFKNLLYNPSSVRRYDTSYLHSLVEISSINQGEKYSVETGKYFSIVTCGDMYDVYSEQCIVDKNMNNYAIVCK